MKRFVFCVLCGILCAFEARTEVLTTIDGIYYSLDEQSKTAVVKCHASLYKSLTELSIPESVAYLDEDYAVTAIEDEVFYKCDELVSAEGASVVSIGYRALAVCPKLTSVSFPCVTTIGKNAFSNNGELTTVLLPAIVSIGDLAFASCFKLASFSFPLATSIGSDSFSSCKALTSVSLPSLVSFGDRAFSGCTALKTASFANATVIGNNAFKNCDKLVTVDAPFARTIGERAFESCDALKSVSVPLANVIKPNAFMECYALESLTVSAELEEEWLVYRGDYGISYSMKPEVSFYKILPEDGVKQATWEAKYVNMPIVGGEVVSEKDYLIACKAYGLTPLQKPDDVQVLPSGCIAVTKESIAAPSAGTVKVEENKVQLGVTVLKTDDLTDEKKDWDEVTLTADDVKVVDGKIVISVPVDSASGFMVIKTKDAKIETND